MEAPIISNNYVKQILLQLLNMMKQGQQQILGQQQEIRRRKKKINVFYQNI